MNILVKASTITSQHLNNLLSNLILKKVIVCTKYKTFQIQTVLDYLVYKVKNNTLSNHFIKGSVDIKTSLPNSIAETTVP